MSAVSHDKGAQWGRHAPQECNTVMGVEAISDEGITWHD
jgi:hypothetical protein